MRSNFEEDMGCSGSPRLDAYRYFTEGAIGTILHIFSIEGTQPRTNKSWGSVPALSEGRTRHLPAALKH